MVRVDVMAMAGACARADEVMIVAQVTNDGLGVGRCLLHRDNSCTAVCLSPVMEPGPAASRLLATLCLAPVLFIVLAGGPALSSKNTIPSNWRHVNTHCAAI